MRSHIHSHRSCKRSPFCSKSILEELSGKKTKLEPETPGLLPVSLWTSDSDIEPDVMFLTCRPQANPGPDLSHASSPFSSLNKTHPFMLSHGPPATALNKTHPFMLSHGPPATALRNGQVLPDAPTTTANKAKQRPSQRKRFKFPIKRVSYLFRRSKRCLRCNFQFWKWRKWEKVRFLLQISKAKRQTIVRSSCLLSLSCCPNPKPKRQAKFRNPWPCPGPNPGCSHKKGEKVKNHLSNSGPNSKAQSQRHTGEFQRCHLQNPGQLQERKSLGSEALGIQGGSEDRLDNCSPRKPCEAAGSTQPRTTSNSLQSQTTRRDIVMGINENMPEKTLLSPRRGKRSSPQKPRESGGPTRLCGATNLPRSQATRRNIGTGITNEKMPEKTLSSRRGKESSVQKLGEPAGPEDLCATVNPLQDQDANRDISEGISSNKMQKKTVPYQSQSQTSVSHKVLIKHIHEFLDGLYKIYGSFIPLQKKDALRHLTKMLNIDFNQRKDFVFSEVRKYQAALAQRPLPSFRVVYKKHLLTLDDLSTLEDQNWLNDQVINMYGELIMDSAHNKVHFFNSFFHRQLVTKGYEGVKRWTKQVDLFSNTLLLVPIHLDVHWCLVMGDTVKKRIHLYDSQGNTFRKVKKNILKYLVTEAKHRQQTAFQNGWMVSDNERIPQQTNENDCGVFILEYCRCLALGKHLQFSQVDIPRIRKRIYKELCDCKLQE